MLVGRILGRLERLDIFFFYLLFLIFMVFSYFSTAGQIFAPFFFPNFTSLLLFYFSRRRKDCIFLFHHSLEEFVEHIPRRYNQPPLNMKQPTNTPDHPRTHEIHFPTSLFFFFFSSLV